MATNKQRREAARRKLESQLVVRQERAKRRRRGNVIASVVAAVLVVAIAVTVILLTGHKSSTAGKAETPAAGTTAAGTTAAGTTAAGTTAAGSAASVATSTAAAAKADYPCTFTPGGTAAKKVTTPTTTTPPRTGVVDLAVTSSLGPLTFQLNRASGPCAVESIISLVKQKYYDNSPCHRLVTAGIFVLQCGDPTGTGTGGPGYTVNDENDTRAVYSTGVIAMANTGEANSTGGQFFIMTKDSSAGLQKSYTVVGKVTAGLPIVEKVAAAGAVTAGKAATDGTPKLPIKFVTVTAPANAG